MSSRKSLMGIILCLIMACVVMEALSHDSATVQGFPVIVLCCFTAFAIQWLMFIPAYIFKTEHYYDLVGSVTHITVMLVALVSVPTVTLRDLLLVFLVLVWASRLGSFLFFRVKETGSDDRFTRIKSRFWWFLMTWTLQGLWVFLTLAMALAALTSNYKADLSYYALLGFGIWAFGFAFEVIADHQKTKFRRDPNKKAEFITHGLWSWSRHPNYFGEMLLWFGVAVVSAPVLIGWQWVGLISPIFVVLLLLKVSGVELLEARGRKKWGQSPAYLRYLEQTSKLIPLPPKP